MIPSQQKSDNSAYRLSRGQYLRSQALTRFLLPNEIHEILTQHEYLGFQISKNPPMDTSNGALYLFDRYKSKNFKGDSVEWIRKKGRDRVREDFVKIQLHGEHKVTGFYTHEANDNTIKRRIYRLAEEGSALHLVHYRRGTGENSASLIHTTETMSMFISNNKTIHDPIYPRILDFSPSYGLVAGGQKILIILSKPLNDKYFTADTLVVAFGTVKVAGELISPDCVKCFSPPRNIESMSLQIISSDGIILSTKSDEAFDFIDDEFIDVQWKTGSGSSDNTDSARKNFQSSGNSVSSTNSPSSSYVNTLSSSSVSYVKNSNTKEKNKGGPGHGLGAYSFPVVSDVANANRLNIGGGLGLGKTFGSSHDQIEGDRVNKIRLVERLGRGKCSQVNDYWMDDEQLRILSDEELSSLLDHQSTAVMHDLLDANVISNELVDEFNNLDIHGHNLLHYCCLFHQVGLIPLLLSRGVDTNRPTKDGFTPLHIAASLSSFSIAQILITHGASLFVKDLQGLYPVQVAHMKGHSRLAKHLYEAGVALISCPDDYKSITFDSTLQATGSSSNHASMDTWDLNYLGPLVNDMFENMSFTDKCALSRTLSTVISESDSGSRNNSPAHNDQIGKPHQVSYETSSKNGASFASTSTSNMGCILPDDFSIDSIRSIVSDERNESLQKAVALLSEDEKEALEKEATSIQTSFRSWILRKNYKTMREGMAKLQTVWRVSQKRSNPSENDMHNAVRNSLQSADGMSNSLATGDGTNLVREREEAAIILQRAIRQVRESAVRSMSLSRQRKNAFTPISNTDNALR